MADISKIQIESGTYNIKDEQARNMVDNKYNRTDNLFLQNYLTYDMSNTYYTQGSTNDENGRIFVYRTSDNVTGDLLIFQTDALTSTISSVPFGHGNGLAYLNNKIYSTYNDKKIKVLDLATTTYTEINPFTDASLNDYTEIFGITKYDDNTLLCALGYTSGSYVNDIDNCLICKLNLTTLEYETFELTNTSLYNIDNLAVQGISYYNEHLYLLVSQPNMVLDFILDSGHYNLNKIYSIPTKDLFGLTVGEVEQISVYLPCYNTFLLTAHVDEGYTSDNRTLKMYFLSFETELSPTYKRRVISDIDAYRTVVYCNSNATTLYENGTSDYPFKSLIRTLCFVNFNKLYDTTQILITGGNYFLGTLYNLNKGDIVDVSGNNVYITGETKLINCNLTFSSINEKINFEKLTLDGSNIRIDGCATISDILLSEYSKLDIQELITTHNVQDVIPIRITKNSQANIMIRSYTTGTYVFYLTTQSCLTTNIDSVYKTGTDTTWIVTGKHTAD